MSGNLIVINGSEGLTWYVSDSKMDELVGFLHKVGFQEQPKEPTNNPLDSDGHTTLQNRLNHYTFK